MEIIPDFNNVPAASEGWFISECSGSAHGPYQLQKDDEADLWANDSDAWEHVVAEAHAGSVYHGEALNYLRTYNRQEFDVIVTFAFTN
jgi:hypothetical protein